MLEFCNFDYLSLSAQKKLIKVSCNLRSTLKSLMAKRFKGAVQQFKLNFKLSVRNPVYLPDNRFVFEFV